MPCFQKITRFCTIILRFETQMFSHRTQKGFRQAESVHYAKFKPLHPDSLRLARKQNACRTTQNATYGASETSHVNYSKTHVLNRLSALIEYG